MYSAQGWVAVWMQNLVAEGGKEEGYVWVGVLLVQGSQVWPSVQEHHQQWPHIKLIAALHTSRSSNRQGKQCIAYEQPREHTKTHCRPYKEQQAAFHDCWHACYISVRERLYLRLTPPSCSAAGCQAREGDP